MASKTTYSRCEASDEDTKNTSGTDIGERWANRVWRRLPFLPFAGILCTILAAGACVAVLVISDGQDTAAWQVKPSVLISIFTALGNASLRYALSEGFELAWWSKATKPRTISRLHDYYTYGTSALSAGLSFRTPRLIALASVLVAIVPIDSPLLQRAITTKLIVREVTSVPVTIKVATQLPFGFTGMEFSGDSSALVSRPLLNPWFSSIFSAYNQRQPIPATSAIGCLGICDGEIEAAGLWKSCNSSEERVVTPSMNSSTAEEALLGRQLFSVGWTHVTKYPPMNFLDYGFTSIAGGGNVTVPEDEPYILLQIDYAPMATNSSRSIFHKTCRLYSATCKYKIRIHNDTQETSLQDPGLSSANTITLSGTPTFINGTVQNVRRSVESLGLPLTTSGPIATKPYWLSLSQPVAFFNNPACFKGFECPLYETLGGLSSAAQDILSGNVTVQETIITSTGALANQFISVLPGAGIEELGVFQSAIGWDDPSDFIFSVLDEIMFRIAVETPSVDILQNVTWLYVHEDSANTIPAPLRNGSDATKYELIPAVQSLDVRQSRTTQVFVSNYTFLAAGMAVMFAAVAGVMPLFYGYWALGRKTSMSPIETAKAFGAPILDVGGSGTTASNIVNSATGNIIVQYGEIVGPGGSEMRLRFDNTYRVKKPATGRLYA